MQMDHFWICYCTMYDKLQTNSKAPRVTAPRYARRLFLTASLIFLDCIFAFFMGNCMDFAIGNLVCSMASANYWRDPRRDMRRVFDMCFGISWMSYHILIGYMELTPPLGHMYFVLAVITVTPYILTTSSKDKRQRQIAHSAMHIMGVILNMTLYYLISQARSSVIRWTV